MERKLMDYLPRIVREYDVFRGITAGQQLEFEQAWEAADKLLANQFILTADSDGLSRWEDLMEITPKGTDTLEDRRFRVLTRNSEEPPYTLPKLRTILESLCGSGNYVAQIQEGTYTLIVKVGLAAKSNFESVDELLQRAAPENLVIDLSLLYNQHSTLSGFTHQQLAAYTHDTLRNEVL